MNTNEKSESLNVRCYAFAPCHFAESNWISSCDQSQWNTFQHFGPKFTTRQHCVELNINFWIVGSASRGKCYVIWLCWLRGKVGKGRATRRSRIWNGNPCVFTLFFVWVLFPIRFFFSSVGIITVMISIYQQCACILSWSDSSAEKLLLREQMK